ncbi:hypothetical protein WJX81_001734 [Elliptochloris bilobata]|uniref:Thioredoxin domain-containing protein n=1 Tax=Elliptochloris bilobata TaxID=381761 RepID=A0AAW1RW09_9CHLO
MQNNAVSLSRSERCSGVEDVTTVHSSAEFESVLSAHPDSLIILMCKAMACRPCKMFTRKFERLAASYPDVVFCEILGDENNDTRRLMMELQIKVTPTFKLYRGRTEAGASECVHSLTGINEGSVAPLAEIVTLP